MTNIIDFTANPSDKDRIKEMARRHFSRNPRLVKSFVRDLAFLMGVIKPRYEYILRLENKTPQIEQEIKNLKEILDNPGLLAKIIVIRERFPTEFIQVQKNPTTISKLEDNPGEDIPGLGVEIKTLITSWPLFKSRNANPANFILLGGSSGTEFRDEIDVGQFISYAQSGDMNNFHEAIQKSPPYKRAEYLTSVINTYNNSDDAVKNNVSKAVLSAIYLVEDISERTSLLNSVITWAENNNGIVFNELGTEQIANWVKGVIGTDKESDQLSKIISETPYQNSDEGVRNRFWEAFVLPASPQTIVGRFATFLTSLLSSFPNKNLILDLIGKDDFPHRIASTPEKINIGNNLATFCINQPFSEEKRKTINLIQKILPDDENRRLLVEHLLTLVSGTDEEQKSYAGETLTKTIIWPENKPELRAVGLNFYKNYYQTLSSEYKNLYKDIIQYLLEKEVLVNKRKNKSVTK